jgi:hypothetical protein
VQIPAQPSTFLFASRDEFLSGGLEFGGQPGRVDGDGQRYGGQGEHVPVGDRQRRFTWPKPDRQ